jgi:hypothetical protein
VPATNYRNCQAVVIESANAQTKPGGPRRSDDVVLPGGLSMGSDAPEAGFEMRSIEILSNEIVWLRVPSALDGNRENCLNVRANANRIPETRRAS